MNENRQTGYTFLTEEILWRLAMKPFIINSRTVAADEELEP